MSKFRLLLLPLAGLYKLATDIRNMLYDKGYKKSMSFDVPVISVGNLAVGGTGKTPFVEMLIRILAERYRPAVLSRGYKRKTTGFRLATSQDDATTIGDEPFQYFLKYGDRVTVAVGEKRAEAIMKLQEEAGPAIIILDDAYQHRSVRPDINILLTDYHKPFYRDYVLPAGMLRESRSHARRADMVVVTKCPTDLSEDEMSKIRQKVMKYTGMGKEVFFAATRYLGPVRFHGENAFSQEVFLFTGIADARPLEQYVASKYRLRGQRKFPDHHEYSAKDLGEIRAMAEKARGTDVCLLTTEKDMVKLREQKHLMEVLGNMSAFYLPIELYFLEKGDFFVNYLLQMIERERKQ